MRVKSIAIFFYLIYVGILVKPIVPVLHYILNYNYIVNQLCENRDKPFLACNGKCFLVKEMKKEQSENDVKNPTNLPKINFDDFLIAKLPTKQKYVPLNISRKKNRFYGLAKRTTSHTNFIFRPPKLV
ncbi:MAG: hypothetical protein ACWA42_02865 [Lutibacter sp.]